MEYQLYFSSSPLPTFFAVTNISSSIQTDVMTIPFLQVANYVHLAATSQVNTLLYLRDIHMYEIKILAPEAGISGRDR